MQRKFIINLLFLLLVNLLVKPFWIFGIDREVQNVVGASGYGGYYALLNLSIIMNILLDAGITNYNNRNISQHSFLLEKYFSGLVGIRLLLAFVYIIVCLIVAFVSGYSSNETFLLLLLCFNQFLLAGILFLRSNIAGLHLFKTDSMISVMDRLLMIILCGTALWSNLLNRPFTIELFVVLQTVAYSITAIVAFILVARKAKRFVPFVDFGLMRVVLKQSLPFALLVLFMSIYNRLDPVLLERMLKNGAEQAGVYAQAYRLFDAGNNFALLFAVLLLPMFARMIKLGDNRKALSNMALGLLMIPASISALVAFFYSEPIMALLYNQEIYRSQEVFSWLMVAFVPMAGSYVMGTLLTANGSLRILNTIAAVAVVSSVIMNILLIPIYGATGPAMVAVGVQSFVFLAQTFYTNKLFGASPNMASILRYAAFIVICFSVGIVVSSQIENWLLGVAVLAIFSLIVSILLKLIKPLEMVRFIRPLESEK